MTTNGENPIPDYVPIPIVYESGTAVGEAEYQLDKLRISARAGIRKNLTNHVREINQLCLESSAYTPTLKSLAYFSEVHGIEGAYRKAQKLLYSKNPIAIGVGVYLETKNLLLNKMNSDFTYYPPNEIVGLEFNKHPVLDVGSMNFDSSSVEVVNYANEAEQLFDTLEYTYRSIAFITGRLAKEVLDNPNKALEAPIKAVLNIYHKGMKEYVEKGVLYTAIEDLWMNAKSPSAMNFAESLMILYEYAEEQGISYEEPYPVFNPEAAEDFMNEMLSLFNKKEEYPVFSSAFESILDCEVVTYKNRSHFLGYLLPQIIYSRLMLKTLTQIKDTLIRDKSIEMY